MDEDNAIIYSEEFTHNPIDATTASKMVNYRASSTGAVILKTEFVQDLKWSTEDGPISLYKDILGQALAQGELKAFNNGHLFFIDIGTVDNYQLAQGSSLTLQRILQYDSKGLVA